MLTRIAKPKGSKTAIGTMMREKKKEFAKDFQKFAESFALNDIFGSPKRMRYQ